ncbi:MAG: DUF2937 family protein [Fulvimarina manganoxydans]|uniref:DUF2937 family protein n=1 Tax=Fulvimarina manganoxydans TaxID=937218 RepID=UPI0023574635|nr:DUF2937 family protein [Fulvimarina manganoxydans]MCK5932349.1 DUF2937 family protein [Fulvimarina manganoxydans]
MIGAVASRLLAALALTGVASQSLEFTQQYLQRLGGAADALGEVVERFDEQARAGGLERGEAIDRLTRNPDDFVAGQGRQMGQTIAEAEAIEARYIQLRETAPILRPVVFLQNPDWDIAERAFEDYRPALPVTMDGVVLTLIGFALGWMLGSMGHGAVRLDKKRREKRRLKRLEALKRPVADASDEKRPVAEPIDSRGASHDIL